ncbi:dihydroorotate dehydrogenase [Rhodonellum psychrophilum GCM71 = DSM 17998]|uniref:Dihydroorotate dehydrogenase n=2 Tax=Rhodonellum TaxID=336827 RepID=U5BZV5_9BACT|nr:MULTISPECIES: ZIP family metal transporter [Rhodonellum]ERM83343.1 dihydroorotate dehydrogenase [Rhodonellum psychrophilum GCM71 = DSM 17998]MDO9551150.1 ZIP family metal transporter [Rhodonellum sp.]
MMESLEIFVKEIGPVKSAFLATSFTWLLTAMGASLVFFFKTVKRSVFDTLLGFTGGVMVAASFWSLLGPSIALSEKSFPDHPWIPAAIGFLSGGLFIFFLDKLMPHLHINFSNEETEGVATKWHKSTLLLLAITMHNIPEGLAVGILFGAAALGLDGATTSAAIALAIGIGIQNFPEGMAVAMPLRRQGVGRRRSFWYGQLSAVVEPVAGVIGAIAVIYVQEILPYALSFAAGAMIFVVVEEVIPETQRDKYTDLAVLGFMGGFTVMMILDVALG